MRMRKLAVSAVIACFAAMMVVAVSGSSAFADTLDPLHGCENAPLAGCADNGTYTPVNSATPSYGFTISPGNQTGEYLVVTLIPNNYAGAGGESFNVDGGASSPATASLFSATPWTTGDLATYLGYTTASPSNPLTAFLPTTQSFDSGASGYFVYVADLGQNTLGGPGTAPPANPSLNDGSFVLPEGTSIVGFLNVGATTPCTLTSTNCVATASSGQLSIDAGPTPAPEPASLTLLGLVLLGFAGIGVFGRCKLAA